MRPGVTMRPLTSRTSASGPGTSRAPISATRPFAKAMSAMRSRFWLGSMTRPPLSTRSAMGLTLLRERLFLSPRGEDHRDGVMPRLVGDATHGGGSPSPYPLPEGRGFQGVGQGDAAAPAGGVQGILEQAGDRHRPDAAWYGG